MKWSGEISIEKQITLIHYTAIMLMLEASKIYKASFLVGWAFLLNLIVG